MSDQPYTYLTAGQREDLLREACRGVELDARQERLLAWMARWDQDTIEGVASIMDAVRKAGGVDLLDLENAIRDRAVRNGC
jgi:hypothetical protein